MPSIRRGRVGGRALSEYCENHGKANTHGPIYLPPPGLCLLGSRMTSRQVSTLCAPLSDPVSTLMLTAGISMLGSGLLSVWN